MLGLPRNIWFGIGGVLLAVVLYLGFSGDDAPGEGEAKVARKKKGTKKKGTKKSERSRGSNVSEAGGVGVSKMCARLDCTQAQLEAFKAMAKAHRKETSAQRRALAEAHAQIAAEFAEEALDAAAIDAAYDAMATQRSSIDDSARGVLEALHAKLSTPQREALAKLVARHGPTMLLARPAGTKSRAGKRGRRGKRRGRKKKGSRRTGPTFEARQAPPAAPEAGGTGDAQDDEATLEEPERTAIADEAPPPESPAAPTDEEPAPQ